MERPTGPAATVLDQVCVDVPAPLWDVEVDCWRRVTGRTPEAGRNPEFVALPPADPTDGLRLLLQRLESSGGRSGRTWRVLTSPDGQTYCLTDRDPATGRPLTPRSRRPR